jgi:hypothetical protein
MHPPDNVVVSMALQMTKRSSRPILVESSERVDIPSDEDVYMAISVHSN